MHPQMAPTCEADCHPSKLGTSPDTREYTAAGAGSKRCGGVCAQCEPTDRGAGQRVVHAAIRVQFVEYQEQYDESNSDVADGGSDSDYNSIDSGAESEDKDFKAAAQREIRAQQRAKAGPSTAGPKTPSGGRRQKRAPKGPPKESEFDEDETGELEDLIVRSPRRLERCWSVFGILWLPQPCAGPCSCESFAPGQPSAQRATPCTTAHRCSQLTACISRCRRVRLVARAVPCRVGGAVAQGVLAGCRMTAT